MGELACRTILILTAASALCNALEIISRQCAVAGHDSSELSARHRSGKMLAIARNDQPPKEWQRRFRRILQAAARIIPCRFEGELLLVTSKTSQTGISCGVAAFGFWGLIPLYFKAVGQVAPLEVLAHRALWSFLTLAVLVWWLGRWTELWHELRNGRLLVMLGLSTLLIAGNWLTFIYAVQTGQVMQSSLGYFINPLVNVLLGVVFLRERLRPYQLLSILLALFGVVVLTSLVGQVPWISLALAFSFALYGLLRKLMPVDGLVSLTVETLLLLPLATGFLVYLQATSESTGNGPLLIGLLMLSGPITTVPLLFFGAAARRLRLSTIGIIQYLTPSLQFLVAVVLFREPFTTAQLLSFACIWTAVALFAVGSLHTARNTKLEILEEFGIDP